MNKSKTHIIYASVIGFLIFSFTLLLNLEQKRSESFKFERDTYKEKTFLFYTESGKNAARIKSLEGTIGNLRTVYSDSLKKLEEELNLKDKTIKSLSNATTVTSGEAETDSTGSFNNRWIQINIKPKDLSEPCLSVSTVSFIIKDSLTFVRYKKGKWYQKKEVVMDGISWSPYTEITGIKDISIKENPNKYTLVVGPGVMYYDGKIRPVLSITFGWKLLER